MDIKIHKKKASGRRNGKTPVIQIQEHIKEKVGKASKEAKPKQATRRKVKSQGNSSDKLVRGFMQAIAYPDIIGPIKIPSSGGAETSFTGMDHSVFELKNTNSAQVCYAWMSHFYDSTSYYALSQAVATTVDTMGAAIIAVTPGIKFPSVAQTTQWNLTTACFTIEYIGAPLNASGEIIFGLFPVTTGLGFNAPTWAVNYNKLYYSSGTRVMPISSLMKEGTVRVSLVHAGPKSLDFVKTDESCDDLMLPFIAATGLDPNGVIKVNVYRNFECKSPLSVNNIPYETQGPNLHVDLDAFQDAMSQAAGTLSTAFSTGFPKLLKDVLPSKKDLLKGIGNLALSSLTGAQHGLITTHLQTCRMAAGIHPSLTLDMLNRNPPLSNPAPIVPRSEHLVPQVTSSPPVYSQPDQNDRGQYQQNGYTGEISTPVGGLYSPTPLRR